MEELASRRWYPGFVVMRWRHLFWMLPLLGLLTGVAWSWMEEFKEISVSGSLEYYGDGALGTPSPGDEKLAVDGIAFMSSDRVLERASFRLARNKPWWANASVASLRSRQTVEFDSAKGIPVIRMTFTGRGKKATEDTWMATFDAAGEITGDDDRARELAKFGAATKKVLRLEKELASLEQSAVMPGSLESLSIPAHDAGNRDIKAVLLELADARKEQDWAQMNLGCVMSFGGVYLISPPYTPALPAPLSPMGMLGLRGALGFGVGAILAVCLAYALQVLKPDGREVVA